MKLNVSRDIIPIGEFKSQMSKWLSTAKSTGHPLIITQNGKPAAVVLSPEEFDKLSYKERFMQSVEQGLSDAKDGVSYETSQVRDELKRRLTTR